VDFLFRVRRWNAVQTELVSQEEVVLQMKKEPFCGMACSCKEGQCRNRYCMVMKPANNPSKEIPEEFDDQPVAI